MKLYYLNTSLLDYIVIFRKILSNKLNLESCYIDFYDHKSLSLDLVVICISAQAERRLLLTGTPLQNNLLELISLLCFLMPDIFAGKTDHLKKIFSVSCKAYY